MTAIRLSILLLFVSLQITTLLPQPLQAQTNSQEMNLKVDLILDTIVDYYRRAILEEAGQQNFYEKNQRGFVHIPEIGFLAESKDLELQGFTPRTLDTWNPEVVAEFLKEKRSQLARQVFTMAKNLDFSLADQRLRNIGTELAAIQANRGNNPNNWDLLERRAFLKGFDKIMILHWYKYYSNPIEAKGISETTRWLSISLGFAIPAIHGISEHSMIEASVIGGTAYTASVFLPSLIYRLVNWNRIRQFKEAFVDHHYPQTITSNQTKNESLLSKLGQEVLDPRDNKLQPPPQQQSKSCRTAFSLAGFLRNNR